MLGSLPLPGPLDKMDTLCLACLKLLAQHFESNHFEWMSGRAIMNGAADAWADGKAAGLGGWVETPAGCYKWFHVPLTRLDFPAEWDLPEKIISKISPLELLAQHGLLFLKLSLLGLCTVLLYNNFLTTWVLWVQLTRAKKQGGYCSA